jgi:hypothetical protein
MTHIKEKKLKIWVLWTLAFEIFMMKKVED